MSAEAWRRRGTHLTPRLFAWQVWYFQHLRLVLRGRRATFGTFVDVRGSLATKGDPFDAAAFCVAGVTLSAPQARFAWQACYFRCLHRCPRKLGDEGGPIWRRGFLRDRCGTFSTLGSFCAPDWDSAQHDMCHLPARWLPSSSFWTRRHSISRQHVSSQNVSTWEGFMQIKPWFCT